jgi:hypothetical protein
MMARDCTLNFSKPGGPNLCIGSESMTPGFAQDMCRWLEPAGIVMSAHFRWTNEEVHFPGGTVGHMSEEFIVDINGRRDRGRTGAFDAVSQDLNGPTLGNLYRMSANIYEMTGNTEEAAKHRSVADDIDADPELAKRMEMAIRAKVFPETWKP